MERKKKKLLKYTTISPITVAPFILLDFCLLFFIITFLRCNTFLVHLFSGFNKVHFLKM